MLKEQAKQTPIIYEIKLKGHLDTKWAEWFYDMTITHERDGTTTLSGPLPDQAVLHSVLNRVRDMNLTLITVRNMEDANQDELKMLDETTPNSEGGVDAA